MKKIKKLLLPLASVAASAAIVAPLITSCGQNTRIATTEIPMDYEPKIQKHEEKEQASPEAAVSDYFKAVKANPTIMAEDYKYSAGQLYSLANELLEEELSNGPKIKDYIEVKLTSFKAGLGDISFNEDGLISYRDGLTVTLEAKIDLTDYVKEELGLDYPCHIYVKADGLGFEANFKNFDTFDISQETSILEGDYTAIRPVFPKDLTSEDWAVGLKLFGGLYASLNGQEMINISDIGIEYTFDYNVAALMFMDLGDLFSSNTNASGNFYVIDLLQYLGSFASYYMSDVHCISRITEDNYGIVDVAKASESDNWTGYITYNNPRKIKPELLAEPTNVPRALKTACPVDEIDTIDDTLATLYAPITLTDEAIAGFGFANEVNYGIAKYRVGSDGKQYPTYDWRERHTVYPRFNNGMTYDIETGQDVGSWTSYAETFYNTGALCAFNFSLTDEGDNGFIGANQEMTITVNDSLLTPTKLTFGFVNITEIDNKTGKVIKTLEEGTGKDYTFTNYNTIKFLKDIRLTEELLAKYDEGITVRIELVSLDAIPTATTGSYTATAYMPAIGE